MKGVFREYTERAEKNGRSLKERYESDTRQFILDSFEDSPTYRDITVYKKDELLGNRGVRINMIERMGSIRSILLKPGENLEIGNMAIFEDRGWLLYDKFGHHESGVKMTAIKANYNLKWIDEDSGSKVPIMKRCYTSSSDIGSKSKQSRANIEYNKYDVKLPYGQLYVFIETTDATRKINLNYRFIINGIVYEVIGLDNTSHTENELDSGESYGIIQFTLRRTTIHPNDNFIDSIAYNGHIKENEDEVFLEKEEKEYEGRGGLL